MDINTEMHFVHCTAFELCSYESLNAFSIFNEKSMFHKVNLQQFFFVEYLNYKKLYIIYIVYYVNYYYLC